MIKKEDCSLGKLSVFFGIILSIISILIPLSVAADKYHKSPQDSNTKYAPGQVIVKFKTPGNDVLSRLQKTAPAQMNILSARPLFENLATSDVQVARKVGLDRIYLVTVPEQTDVEKYCRKLMRTGLVEYAEPNYIVPVEAVPNDSLYNRLWHLPKIQAPDAWDVAKGDSNVIIAIIDTGVDWDHPDLAASIWRNTDEVEDGTDTDGNGFVDDIRGWDFVDNVQDYAAGEDGIKEDNNPMDFAGHGTFVAGFAAAVTNNGIGVSSISWGCRIMPLRVGYRTYSGGYIQLGLAARAFRYAADNGASIINFSTSSSNVLVDAARYAFEKGVVIVKSAGNLNQGKSDPLELEPYVITVAAVDNEDVKASYSDYGEWVTVSAPGGDVSRGGPGLMSTAFDNRYGTEQGTSYASPIVAGLCALVKSAMPELSPADIIFRVVETTDNIDAQNPAYVGQLGSGRVNAYRALTEQVQAAPDLSVFALRIDDALQGNGNEHIDAGERVKLFITLKNSWGNAENVYVSLQTDNPFVTLEKDAVHYTSIPGLSELNANLVENSTDPFIIKVAENAYPQKVQVQITITANGGFVSQNDLNLMISPSVLLVDDDAEDINVESYYQGAMDTLGIAYEMWNRTNQGAPPLNVLQNYSTVVWFCEGAFPSLDSLDRAVLANYLDQGGRLFISGQDIGWDLCDESGVSQDNEFGLSNGASREFYRRYFHADYLNDDSNYSHLLGVASDPIGDGLEFDIYQPGRGSYYQWPSEVRAIAGGEQVFVYPNGLAGAVRYADSYRLVYFAFGGFEAIKSREARLIVLPRVLNWLNGVRIKHQPLANTEDTTHEYPVSAEIITEDAPIESVALYWQSDASPTVHKMLMQQQSDSLFTASIPAQTPGNVRYAIVAHLLNDYFTPVQFHEFYVGPDTNPPVLTKVLAPDASLYKDNILFRLHAEDDIGVDTTAVYLHYAADEGAEDSVRMGWLPQKGIYQISLSDSFRYGQDVIYYFSAVDQSVARNRAATDPDTLVIGLDNFENGLDNWIVESGTWGLDYSRHFSGAYSLNDSPLSDIVSGQNAIIKTLRPLDLSKSMAVKLSFKTMCFLREQKDFGYVELNAAPDTTWTRITEPITGVKQHWASMSIPLDQFIGQDSVYLRFRLVTDPELTFGKSGWYIDDVQILEEQFVGVRTLKESTKAPELFSLSQNYPNPFNPTTSIVYNVPRSCEVELVIYNSLGQKIKTLIHSRQAAGQYTLQWNGSDDHGHPVTAGIYLLRMRAGDFIAIKKMALIR